MNDAEWKVIEERKLQDVYGALGYVDIDWLQDGIYVNK